MTYNGSSTPNLNTYGGGLFENIVAEAIKKSGGDLYYYRREDSRLYLVGTS